MKIRFLEPRRLAFLGIAIVAAACADSGRNPGGKPAGGAPAANSSSGSPVLVADPNPIRVCDGSGTGVTTLRNMSGIPGPVEIRVDSPTGKLFAQVGPGDSAVTGKWVRDGMTFHLVRGTDALGSVAVGVTRQGCP